MDARRLWLSGLALFTLAICGPAAIVGIAPVRADEVTDWNAIADGSLHQSRAAQVRGGLRVDGRRGARMGSQESVMRS